MLVSWGSRLVMRDIVEQRAQRIDSMIRIIVGKATPNKQHARIFKTVGEWSLQMGKQMEEQMETFMVLEPPWGAFNNDA